MRSATSPTILIVDENMHFCRMLSQLFETLGWRVRVANSGAEARRILGMGGLDLLISEIALVGETGLELAAYAETRNVPVLLLSSNPERRPELVAKRYAFVDKSVLFGALVDYLRSVRRAPSGD